MLLAIVLAAIAIFVGMRVTFDSIEERFVNQLIEAGKLSSEWTVREENRMLETLRYVMYTDGVLDALKAENAEKLRELIYPIAVNAGDTVEILNTQGVAVVSLRHRIGGNVEDYEFSRGDEFFTTVPSVQKIAQGQADKSGDKYAEIVFIQREPYLFILGPLTDAQNKTIGVVAVGKPLSTIAQQIRLATLAQITLYTPTGQVLATTALEDQPLASETTASILSQKDTSSYRRDITLSSIDHSEIVGSWQVRQRNDLGLIGVAFAKNFLVRVSQNTWVQLLASSIIALAVVLLFGNLVSRQISNPILKLGQAAEQVAGGNLQIHVQPVGGKEVTSLTKRFNEMVAHLCQAQDNLVTAYDTTLEGWVTALDLRDHETSGHSRRVSELTVNLARRMNIAASELENIRRGALLHDMGKIAIPDQILLKPASLTPDEWKIMRQHPAFALGMLKDISFLRLAMDIPGYHHEKWDGSGYPNGLEGEAIPLAARLFAVIDAWDCLTSGRPYRASVSSEEACRIIESATGTHFDPQAVQAFFEMLRTPSGNAS